MPNDDLGMNFFGVVNLRLLNESQKLFGENFLNLKCEKKKRVIQQKLLHPHWNKKDDGWIKIYHRPKERALAYFYHKLSPIFKALFSVTRKKSPNVYKSCPNMISLEK